MIPVENPIPNLSLLPLLSSVQTLWLSLLWLAAFAPQPEGLRGFWPGALLLVGQRPPRVFSLLAPRTQPKFAAALLYEPQTWCTNPFRRHHLQVVHGVRGRRQSAGR